MKNPPESKWTAVSAEEKPVLDPHDRSTSLHSSPGGAEEVCVQTSGLAREHLETPNSNLPLDFILPVLLGCGIFQNQVPRSHLQRAPGIHGEDARLMLGQPAQPASPALRGSLIGRGD